MSQPLVLAIEPDLRQAAIVKRIVREQALADVAVVDSLDAAIEAMRTAMPDVLLLSALMSPRDEDHLITHLKTLEHAGHLQTHTIPQLASTLQPGEARGSRGLLSAFRRKKDRDSVPSGCDPDLFADEIRVFLQRAADKRREMENAGHAALDMRPSAAGAPQSAAAPAPSSTEPPPSSWSSPFEWKPSGAASSPASPIARPDSPIANRESLLARESSIATTEFPLANPESPSANPESLMAHLRPPAGIPTAEEVSRSFDEPPPLVVEAPVVHVAQPAVLDAQPPVIDAPPVVIEAPAVRVNEPILVSAPVQSPAPIQAPPVLKSPVAAARPEVKASPAEIKDSRPAIKESGSAARDKRTAIKDSGLGIRDRRAREASVGTLASWARSEDGGAGSRTRDDLRALLTGLAVPSSVVAVGYARGCRIRRVRVPAARESQEAESAGAGVLPRRASAGQREQPRA